MNKKTLKISLLAIVNGLIIFGVVSSFKSKDMKDVERDGACQYNIDSLLMNKIEKSDADWKKQLTSQEFDVARNKGTERAFTGELLSNKKKGVYTCKCCDMPLFDSDTKFDSGTGWPSYSAPVENKCITEHSDTKYGMVRTEVTCARCDAHLGHVFPDGPEPTGLRYCINSVSLDFCEDK